jgi:penicillin-binding protein 1A
MMFDKVSKKKATDCTPTAARIELGVSKTTDPITKKETVTANDGYDASADDDVHVCGDTPPSVTISQVNNTVKVSYQHGRFQLQSIEITQGGTTIASQQVGSDGIWTLTASQLSSATSGTLTATVTDTGYYQTVSSTSYSAS